MKKLTYIILIFSAVALSAQETEFRTIENKAFGVGERLTFDVKYGFVTAGVAEMYIPKIRRIAGSTDPEQAEPTSIRGKYGRVTRAGVFENVVHASEDEENAEREIKMWFRPDELVHTLYPTELKEEKIPVLFWK